MTTRVYTVSVEFDNADDARAFADIVSELGVEPSVVYRTIGGRNDSPMIETRLGIIVIEAMATAPSHEWHVEEIADIIERAHFARASANVALSMMCRQGAVERVARGVYRLIEKS